MGFYLYRTPSFIASLFPNVIWTIPGQEKTLYLTFDDGPTPDVTAFVLDTLAQFEAKATFFVVGSQVAKYPDIFLRTIECGHAIGNHTYEHDDGWLTSVKSYVSSIERTKAAIAQAGVDQNSTALFRPPYGRITPWQIKELHSYQVVMWKVLCGDFDPHLRLHKSWDAICKSRGGDIIVFHDSVKAQDNLKYLLPKTLEYFSALGFQFKAIHK